jgi:hypothetical protein
MHEKQEKCGSGHFMKTWIHTAFNLLNFLKKLHGLWKTCIEQKMSISFHSGKFCLKYLLLQ